jgi:hypothetical protein
MNAQTGIINIRGKEYQTVALRVQMFRERFPDHSLLTRVVDRTPECVVMVASIEDTTGRTIATGHAEEYRSSSQINKTSALENAETSAIGRALAAFGIGGTEFASANEVQNAIHQQGAPQGHSQTGEVSPEAPKRSPAWDTPIKNKSNLHKAMAALERELAGCGDSDMVYVLTATQEWRDFVETAQHHAAHYLYGGDPAPPEFEGLLNTAERLVREFDTATANHVLDVARA